MNDLAIWTCKMGYANRAELPLGADGDVRKVVEAKFKQMMNRSPEFIFSGWAGQLSEGELAVVEDRHPKGSNNLLELIEKLDILSGGVLDEHKEELSHIITRLKYMAIVEKLNGG
jgi:hypothetical protein